MFGYKLIKETELQDLRRVKWSMDRLYDHSIWPNQRFVHEFLKGFLATPGSGSNGMWSLRDRFDSDLKEYVESEHRKTMERFDAGI